MENTKRDMKQGLNDAQKGLDEQAKKHQDNKNMEAGKEKAHEANKKFQEGAETLADKAKGAAEKVKEKFSS